MEPPRAPHKEMTDPNNRNVLATLTIKTIGCAQRAIAQSRELEVPEMEERVLDFVMMTAGLEGRAREDLRDALAGARPATPALGGLQAPNPLQGRPHL